MIRLMGAGDRRERSRRPKRRSLRRTASNGNCFPADEINGLITWPGLNRGVGWKRVSGLLAVLPLLAAWIVFDGATSIVLEELGNAQKVRIGGLLQLTVRVKPAQKARKGRNPATGEEITIAAKPASVDLRARPLAKAKAALPTVQKARRRLAA
jgi:Bacterial DNA-binding protein